MSVLRYPWSDGTIRDQDPTYGRIDHDIQWWVNASGVKSLAQRTALEHTIQAQRDDGRPVLAGFTLPDDAVDRTRHGVDDDTHILAMRAGLLLVFGFGVAAAIVIGIVWNALA